MPTISIVIPVLNAEAHIGRCLGSVLRQDYPVDAREILVADNGSTDRTTSICEELGVTPLREPRRGAGNARNRALAAARGELVAFTDADCELPADWLRRAAEAVDGAEAAVGWIDPAPGANRYAFARAALHREYLAECRKLHADGRLDRLDTANSVVRRSALEAAGGFHPEVFPAEDRELGARIAERGGRIRFADALRVQHHYERRLRPSLRKARGVGHVYVRLAELFCADYLARHFPDVAASIETARRSSPARVRVKLWASVAAACLEPRFAACRVHVRRATVFAIRLGILDRIGGGTRGAHVPLRRAGET